MESATIKAEKMVSGGDCIAKIDGKTVFVPYSVPGETLSIQIEKEMRDYSTARIVEVLEPSPHRTKPFCPLYTKCGGCNMQHIESSFQTQLRSSILRDAFEREGVELEEINVVSASPSGYRARFQLHDGGLMEKRSNRIIPIQNCPCATAEVNKYLAEMPFDQRPSGRVHVFGTDKIVSIPDGFDKIIICNEDSKKETRVIGKRTMRNGRPTKKIKKVQSRFEGASVKEENLCTVNILGKSITFDVKGFFQSNMQVLEKTIPLLTEGLGGKHVLDMYAGAGTFSVFLADLFSKVTLVEHNKSAIVYAEQNLFGTSHESFGLSGAVWVKYHAESCIERNGNFDAVVIDPPRSGMEKEVCSWLCSSGIRQIRSLSCDIATHARDVGRLVKSGYKLKSLYLLDFYPQTCNIESLALLEK